MNKETREFIYWLMDNCQLITDEDTGKNVLWRYESEDYSVDKLFEIYKDSINVCLDNKSKLEQMEKDIESYKNRIRVLQNLNFKYREKLGISNEPIDAINPVNECTHENIKMKSSGIWKCKCGYINY